MKLRRLLAAVDMGPASDRAVDIALAFAKKLDCEVTLVHAFSLPTLAYANGLYVPYDALASGARRDFDAVVARAKQRHPRVEAVWCEGDPREKIVETARTHRADLVVMGTHGRRGLPRALLGSVAERVLRTSPAPVLTTPAYPAGVPLLLETPFRRVLAATDFGEPAQLAIDTAAAIATAFSADLLVLHAYDTPAVLDDDSAAGAMQREAELALGAVLTDVRGLRPDAEAIVERGDARDVILDVVRRRAIDLVVLGTHARRGVSRLLLGSVAEAIARTSPVPVLTTSQRA